MIHTTLRRRRRMIANGIVAITCGLLAVAGMARAASNPVRAPAPVYLMASFTAGSPDALSIFSSVDGATFTSQASEAYAAGLGTPGRPRDAVLARDADGYYYVAHTGGSAGADIGMIRSKNLAHWEALPALRLALPGAAGLLAPAWLRDNDGSLKLVVSAAQRDGAASYLLSPGAGFVHWSVPLPLQGLQGYRDAMIVATGDGYVAIATEPRTGSMELVTADSLTGPWTVRRKGDWAGWGAGMRAGSLLRLPDGGWRMYMQDQAGKHCWYADGDQRFGNWTAKREVIGVSGVARHAAVTAEDPLAYAAATRPAGRPRAVTWDARSLMLDGERIMVWSGEFHPFRLPSPALWRDVLQKMRASGFNSVAFYFDWGYHSPAPGVYDFTGVRNVERALQMAEEEGLYVIARAGPYVNAELSGGGFPGWMLRNRAEARTDDPAYLAAADEWMTQINTIIARHQLSTGGGNVIAYQLENELGKVEPKHARYMRHLADKARADGITVPLFHNGADRAPDWTPQASSAPWANPGPTDLYAFDSYPGGACDVSGDPSGPNRAANWGIHGMPGGRAGSLSSPTTPGFAAELGGGWFDYWGSNGTYGCTSVRQGKGYQRVFYGTNLINRITIHNIYMAFGGTSWGWLGAPVVYTSYDYGAAIAEDRGLREKAYALKQQGMLVQAARQVLAGMDKGPELSTSNPRVKVYHNVDALSGAHVLFAVHHPSDALSDDRATVELTGADGAYTIPLRVAGQDAKLLLASYAMERQHLVYSTSELQTHFKNGERDIALLQGRDGEQGETVLRYASVPAVEVLSGKVSSAYDAARGDLKLSYIHAGLARVRISGGGRAPLLLLLADEKTSFDMWRQDTARGAVLQLTSALVRSATFDGATLALSGDTQHAATLDVWGPPMSALTFNGLPLALTAQPDGSVRTAVVLGPRAIVLPDLGKLSWTRRMDSPEARPGFDDAGWIRADSRESSAQVWTSPERGQPTLSMSDYGFHHGDVWYRGRVALADPRNNQLQLFYGGGGAGMLQAWVDGKFLGQHELDTGRSFPETTDSIKFSLGKLTAGEHVIAVMVRNNSHNWDLIADDYHREARGLISASLTSRGGRRFAVPIAWRIQGTLGGEDVADILRGPLNNGGLYGERQGWHLPGRQDGWRAASPTSAPPAAGTYWLRTGFELDLPAGHDVQLGLAFGDASRPRSDRQNRALIFVNGWNMGQFIANIGPQRTFVIPPGILNPNGRNTIALAVTTDGQPENALEAVKLVNLRTVRGGVPLEIMRSDSGAASLRSQAGR